MNEFKEFNKNRSEIRQRSSICLQANIKTSKASIKRNLGPNITLQNISQLFS